VNYSFHLYRQSPAQYLRYNIRLPLDLSTARSRVTMREAAEQPLTRKVAEDAAKVPVEHF
jgi:hypothetical protein